MEDLYVKTGTPTEQLIPTNTWTFEDFTHCGTSYAGKQKTCVFSKDNAFRLKYNTVNHILVTNMKIVIKILY